MFLQERETMAIYEDNKLWLYPDDDKSVFISSGPDCALLQQNNKDDSIDIIYVAQQDIPALIEALKKFCNEKVNG